VRVNSQRDFWSGLMFLGVGIAFAWGATSYSFGRSAQPGPGYFPFGLGVILALLGAAILFKSLTVETEDGEPLGHIPWKPLIVIIVSVVIFGAMLPKLGILVSLPVLVLMSSWPSEEFSWKASLINAVVLTVGSWLVFVKGLNLPIPVLPVLAG
jgi:hypothetical protein